MTESLYILFCISAAIWASVRVGFREHPAKTPSANASVKMAYNDCWVLMIAIAPEDRS
jgi:hypothetical protein